MASLLNSLRNIIGDRWWFVKLGALSSILFFALNSIIEYPMPQNSVFAVYLILGVLFMGCASVLMNRNINNRTPMLPSLFSIFEVLIKSVGATISILPGFVLYAICIYFVQTNLVAEKVIMIIIYLCITVFFIPLVFIPPVLYSVRGSLKDAFNFSVIYRGSGNFTVQFFSYVIQYLFLFFCILILPIYFTLVNMLGDHISLLVLKSITIVITIFSFFSYCADLYQDAIPEIKRKKKVKKSNSNKNLKR